MTASGARPSVRMTEEEIWDFLVEGHTGVFTTLRSDGSPISLPVWYAVVNRRIYTHTRGKKLLRVRSNPVSSFLVEDGEKWSELRAVHLAGTARIIEPSFQLQEAIDSEIDRKYSQYRTPARDMPDQTRVAYSSGFAWVEFSPEGKVLNWNNAHLRQ